MASKGRRARTDAMGADRSDRRGLRAPGRPAPQIHEALGGRAPGAVVASVGGGGLLLGILQGLAEVGWAEEVRAATTSMTCAPLPPTSPSSACCPLTSSSITAGRE